MNEIVTALQKIPSDGPAMALVTGIGGAGKTQIALKYAYDHDDEYVTLWVKSTRSRALDMTIFYSSMLAQPRVLKRRLYLASSQSTVSLVLMMLKRPSSYLPIQKES